MVACLYQTNYTVTRAKRVVKKEEKGGGIAASRSNALLFPLELSLRSVRAAITIKASDNNKQCVKRQVQPRHSARWYRAAAC